MSISQDGRTVTITLTPEQERKGVQVGQKRHKAQRRTGRADWKVRKDANGLKLDEEGACAELAVSIGFGLPWDGSFIPMSKWDLWRKNGHDVSGLEIRSTKHPSGRLILHKNSKDTLPFILVLTHNRPTYQLVGWCYAKEGKKEAFWQDVGHGRPCFYVPQEDLQPMSGLFQQLGLETPERPQAPSEELDLDDLVDAMKEPENVGDELDIFEDELDIDLDELLGEEAPPTKPSQPAAASAPPPAAKEPEATPATPAPPGESDEDDDFDWDELSPPEKDDQKPAGPDPGASEDDDDDDWDFLEEAGLQQQQRVGGTETLVKPWMRYHQFNLVKTVAEVREIVDAAIAHKRCALDLETDGFDNRIDYDANGDPHTRHKIVGYCISVKGAGYYIPLRHKFDKTFDEADPNVGPLAGVNAEIKRLCEAAQPEITPEGLAEDPIASSKIKTPGKLKIYFWNAKFDHEYLYPVTGIDAWHPSSYEDGMLSAYVYYTDDKSLGLKGKAAARLFVTDPDDKGPDGTPIVHPYEMIKFEDLFPKGVKRAKMHFAEIYPEEGSPVVMYGCSDAICTEILCEAKRVDWVHTKEGLITKYDDVLSPTKKVSYLWSTYHRIEKQAAAATREMERPRQKIDLEETKLLLEEAKKELVTFESRICNLAASKGFHGFNPSSPQQLGDFLFGPRGLDITPKPDKTASEQFKTDAATLEAIHAKSPEIEVLDWIVKYRQVEKVIGTYLTGIAANCDENDCLRFNFKQHGAATGRFTAPKGLPEHGFSGIPIHGIPARNDPNKPKAAQALRRLFVARDGYTMVKVDYAGQELRVVANISGEQVWIKEFLEGDGDLHTLTAEAFYPGLQRTDADFKLKRTAGKIANFSLIYGGGIQAIMRATGCDKVEAARKLNAFHKSVAQFAAWVKGQHNYVKAKKGVFTGFKRFIRIPDACIKVGDKLYGKEITEENDARRIRAACERKSTNYPIQGSGADILKISMIKLHKELIKRGWLRSYGGDDSVRMVMTVHDEIVFEVKHERLQEAMPLIIECMQYPSRLIKSWPVKLIVEPEVGPNWEAKYDWLKIMDGSIPVPDWLKGHVTPGDAPTSGLLVDPTPSDRKPSPAPDSSNEPDAKPDEKATPTSTPGTHEVVTFTIPRAHVTLQLVPIMMEIVAGSVKVPDPHTGKALRVLNTDGEVLIDPSDQVIKIDPKRLGQKLRERNLGRGVFEVTEERL